MSEQTARERIAEAVESAMIDGFHALEPETQTWNLNIQLNTDRIIAIVREALLDNWTLIASGKIVQKEPQFGHSDEAGLRAMLVSKMAVEAALDAAFGTDDE